MAYQHEEPIVQPAPPEIPEVCEQNLQTSVLPEVKRSVGDSDIC